MREMKDSGIEWIGEIPADWEVSTIKREYVFQTGWTPDTTHEEYFVGENIWINISDMKSKVVYDSEKHISDEAVRLASMNISPKGSLLYAFKLSVGAVSFCGIDMYTNEAIATFLPGKNNLRFLYYTAPIFIIKNANENIYGAKLLNQKLIRNAKIVIPPLEVQKRIVDYLDRKCGQIDAIIARQQEVIEKLKAYKLSVITEAVTKGLNPDVPMKDSGVEWIGEIPEHWVLNKLKYLSLDIGDGIHATPTYDEDGNVYFVNGNNIGEEYLVFKEDTNTISDTEYASYKLPLLTGNTVFVTLNGATYGKTSFYHGEKILLGKSAGFITLKPTESREFVRYYLQSYTAKLVMDLSLLGSTIANLSLRTLRDFVIPYPPREEQIKIVLYLSKRISSIDAAASKKEKIVRELTDYKKSLIYEVVTGKKKV